MLLFSDSVFAGSAVADTPAANIAKNNFNFMMQNYTNPSKINYHFLGISNHYFRCGTQKKRKTGTITVRPPLTISYLAYVKIPMSIFLYRLKLRLDFLNPCCDARVGLLALVILVERKSYKFTVYHRC